MLLLTLESRHDRQSFITSDHKLAVNNGMYGNIHHIWDAYKKFESDTIHIIQSPPLVQVVNSRHKMTVIDKRREWINHLIALTTEGELMLFNRLYPEGIKIELPDNSNIKNGEIIYIMLWELNSHIDYLVVIDVNHTMRFISLEDLLINMLKFSSSHYNDRVGFEQLTPIENIVSVTISAIHYGCLYWLDQSGIIGWINSKKRDDDSDSDCDDDQCSTTVTIYTGNTDEYRDYKFTSLRYGYAICDCILYSLESIRRSYPKITGPMFVVGEGGERKIVDVYSWPINVVLFDDGSIVILDCDIIHGIKGYERIIKKYLPNDARINRFIIDCDHHMTDMELDDGTIVSINYHKSKILPYQVLWYQPSSHPSVEYINTH